MEDKVDAALLSVYNKWEDCIAQDSPDHMDNPYPKYEELGVYYEKTEKEAAQHVFRTQMRIPWK